MEKLKLNLDDLNVDSFRTEPERARDAQGTVHGYVNTEYPYCDTIKQCETVICPSEHQTECCGLDTYDC